YLWIFGDGGTSTQTNPSHTYSSNGYYTVKLVANNANGCPDTLVKTNYVKIEPANIILVGSGFGGCAPSTGTLTVAVLSSLFPITNYVWNFGDGSPTVTCSHCPNQNHTYLTPGNYNPSATVTAGGCTYTVSGPLS